MRSYHVLILWGNWALGAAVLCTAGCTTKFTDPPGTGSAGTGGSVTQEECRVTLEAPKLALFVLAERSVAMNANLGGQVEGNAQYTALDAFFSDESNAGIMVGAAAWPAKTGDSCTAAAYTSEFQEMSKLPDATIVPALVGTAIFDGEPSNQGVLVAAHAAAGAYADAHPDSISDVVFLVSGFGGSCGEARLDDVVERLELATDAGTRTWIVAGQALSGDEHEQLAAAGGGKKLSPQRETALSQLPKEARACRYVLPAGANGPRYGGTSLVEVADASVCGSEATQQYFLNSQGHIELCPATCSAVGLQKLVATTACDDQ